MVIGKCENQSSENLRILVIISESFLQESVELLKVPEMLEERFSGALAYIALEKICQAS